MLARVERIRNGDHYEPFEIYTCNRCSEETSEMDRMFKNTEKDYHLCWDCGYIEGRIGEKEFIRGCGICLSGFKAVVKDGKAVIYRGKQAPWEMTNRDYRRTPKYRQWRIQVLKRDSHTCQHCGSLNKLQAHHIKTFSTHESLRYEVSNGLTLCEKCHRTEHKKIKQGCDTRERCISNK